jgi:hypothetical protein
MQKILIATLLIVAFANLRAQTDNPKKYFLSVTADVSDTTEWIDCLGFAVSYSLRAHDSMVCVIKFEASDTTASTSKLIPRIALTRTVNEDSLANLGTGNPQKLIANVIRNASGSVDKMKGLRYLRAIIDADTTNGLFGTNDSIVGLVIHRQRLWP